MASSPEFETLLYELRDGIAIVTLNRPQALNAFTDQMGHDLMALFDHTDGDDEVRAVIVTGAGRAFCAGADLGQGAATFDFEKRGRVPESETGVLRDMGGRITLRIFASLKPVIAAVNGAAVGVGATMQLPMDIRIAADTARYGFVFARRGIVPEAASSWFLPRLVGISRALEWCYGGQVFPASEALSAGLVRSLHKPEDLLEAAITLAHALTDHSAPVSVAMTRQMLWRMLGAEHPMVAHRMDSRGIQERGRSEDAHEGVMSFLEKREARYRGRVSDGLPPIFGHLPKQEFE